MTEERAHEWTDRRLAAMENRLTDAYQRANDEIQQKIDEHFRKYAAMDAEKIKLVQAGKLEEEELLRWRRTQVFIGEQWKEKKEMVTNMLYNANKTALAYIRDELPEIYAVNFNAVGEVSPAIKAVYPIINADVVKNLLAENQTFLPYKIVNKKKDVRWNTKKINAEVLQGILQGESIGKIASRLQAVTEMNRVSAIRNARTMVTGAENKGRYDGRDRLEKMGVITGTKWIATHDGRARHAHWNAAGTSMLDGQIVDHGKPFRVTYKRGKHFVSGTIRYPGDPSAPPELVYNCRCTTKTVIKGFRSTLPKELQGKIKVNWS